MMNDTGKISIQINSRLFHRLQSVAEPLIDDTDSVIEKLLSHWETSPPSLQGNGKNFWISPRGERFPIGTKFRAEYDGEKFEAVIMKSGIFFSGETFSSPSAAAIHAKKMQGLLGTSANTNGWKFWEYWDEESQAWLSINRFRRK